MVPYALTIFAGAFLLFQVQPLIGKYILPWFGGAPGVWTICLLFFQLVLLGGYAYAHLSARWLKPRGQVVLHFLLLGVALSLLPITPTESWKPGGGGNPTLQILGLLTGCVGLPFLVLSATGPLLQHWFSRAHPGVPPYRLYALSNVGSLLALVSFPVFFETHFTRSSQASLWGWGLVAYALGCGLCARIVWASETRKPKAEGNPNAESRSPKPEVPISVSIPAPTAPRSTLHAAVTSSKFEVQGSRFDVPPPHPSLHAPPAPAPSDFGVQASFGSRFSVFGFWLLLPACASVLLMATTNKICQDVAVIPFLWVLPLSLYLLSFIICFDSPRWYARFPFALALLVALAAIAWVLFQGNDASTFLQIGIYSVGLFICCMVCHGELYRLRPDPRQLTAFYLMIAAGGALGGVFVAVIAPLIFTDYYELQWGLLLCLGLLLVIVARSRKAGDTQPTPVLAPGRVSVPASPSSAVALVGTARLGHKLATAALAVCLLGLAAALWWEAHRFLATRVAQTRTFYGVLTVSRCENIKEHLYCRELTHGHTSHGMQFIDSPRAAWPTTYYGENSGAGLALGAMPAGSRRIGLVGLGTGTLTTYARAGDYVHIYEINPEIQRLAKTWFSFLANCPAKVDITLGDARLTLEKEPPQDFDLLALDTFSSDAIPIHLLTREAFAIYDRHLKTNGLIAIHISNRFLDLEPVVANLARHFQYQMAVVDYNPSAHKPWLACSTWMLLARSTEAINSPILRPAARPTLPQPGRIPLWTDDFASLFQVLRRETDAEAESAATKVLTQSARHLLEQTNYPAAIAQYRLALKGQPEATFVLVDLALVLALGPDPALRNIREAIQLMERACQQTRYAVPPIVGTLAAVYSEDGRFSDAIQMQEKACYLTQEALLPTMLLKNQELLKYYRAGRPYHEFVPANPSARIKEMVLAP